MDLPTPNRSEIMDVYRILNQGSDRILIEQFQILVSAMLKKMIN